jgi:UDP-galactose transporter B1
MHQTPIWEYALQAATTSLAMLCSFMALEHIDYPTQALAKSCKPIPVMLMGVFILKRKYSIFKYAYVGLIVAGIAVFMLEQVRNVLGPGSPSWHSLRV